MTTHLEPYARKTKEYAQYIFDEIVKRSPLKPGELIEVRVIEGTTPFPKITEIPVRPDIEGAKSNDVMEQIKGGWHYSSDPSKQIETWTKNKDARHEMKIQELNLYTDKILGRICGYPLYEINTNDPLDITFRFVIMSPEKIRGWMQELGLKIPPKKELTHEKTERRATFTETPPQILWLEETINIPPDSKELDLCRVAFGKPVGENIDWEFAVKEMDWALKRNPKKGLQTIADAIRRLNKRINAKTGQNLFVWTEKAFYRDA